MAATLLGEIDWGVKRDKEGYRDYNIAFQVRTSTTADGPNAVMNCPGLPAIGSTWSFFGDADAWCFCSPEITVSKMGPVKEKGQDWKVENIFTNRPQKRCQDTNIDDPLNEPAKLSGSFVKYVEEARYDKDGTALRMSNLEPIVGKMVEKDNNRPTVRVEQNIANLDLATWSPMVDTLNDATLWGLGPRKIKLSGASWSRKLYGVCNFYYTRALDFDVRAEGYDRRVPDRGHRYLPANHAGPAAAFEKDWLEAKDAHGENTEWFLDGNGRPLPPGAPVVDIDIELYDESNFLLLAIPTSL